ncbi:MAG: MEDS domain-containing protein [Candidatus Omnitrophota bacterium]|nr:MEDS domain-containing protein [Candidatus Omnitrophota bacterium]
MLNCQEIKFGMHICNIYRDKTEQLSVLIPYLAAGLKQGEKCIYIFEDITPDQICGMLAASGIDTKSALSRKQLVFLSFNDTYLADGYFSGLRMLDAIQELHFEALMAKFSGVRGAGEMGWHLSVPPGASSLIEYENNINSIVPKLRFISLCQYDETRHKQDTLLGVLHTHPEAVIYGNRYSNPHYIMPSLFQEKFRQHEGTGIYAQLRDRVIQ